MVDTKLADHLAVFVGHKDDNAIDEPTGSAGLVVDGFEGAGDDLEIVVRLQYVLHFCLVPDPLEWSTKQTDKTSDEGQLAIVVAKSKCDSKGTIRTNCGSSQPNHAALQRV